MKILIDTNVIIDILEHREPFFMDSYKVIQLSLEGKLEAVMSAGAVTDVYYIISRSIRDHNKAREKIVGLTALVRICDTFAVDITAALTMNISDFEDAVVSAIAKREKANYIITRNEKDFTNSSVPAISPAQFLYKFDEGIAEL
jgi:predicted nucleic acid-binding protein